MTTLEGATIMAVLLTNFANPNAELPAQLGAAFIEAADFNEGDMRAEYYAELQLLVVEFIKGSQITIAAYGSIHDSLESIRDRLIALGERVIADR